MKDNRKSKKALLVRDFSEKIRRGCFVPGSEFPSIDELMRCCKISSATAGRLTRELAAMGLLDVGRGRRSRVRHEVETGQFLKLNNPVGVISPASGFSRHSRWREYVLHDLQRKMLEHGNDARWLSEAFDPETIGSDYAGFIFAGDLVPLELWGRLHRSGIPCVKLSLERPEPNTVFLDYRPVIDRLTLAMVECGCRRVIYLTASEAEAARARAWSSSYGFYDNFLLYGIANEAISYPVVVPERRVGIDELRRLILTGTGKIAFAAGSPECMQWLADLMTELGGEPGADFELFAMSRIPHETVIGHYIDVRCEIIVERMLSLFYRHFRTGKPQVGEIVYPELVLR